jgi:membrane-associated phospholipid phosphatase
MRRRVIYLIIRSFIFSFLFYSFLKAQDLKFTEQRPIISEFRLNSPLISKEVNRLNNFNSGLSTFDYATSNTPDLNLFGNFGNNILDSFKGDNLYLHLAGVASTFLLVSSNIDYHVEKFFNEHEGYGNAARPVIRIAMYFPFVVSGSLYAYGKLKKDNEAVGASFAVLQSSLIALAYNSLLKAITGRPHPDWRNNKDMKSLSKTFRFGFLRGGVFWGWPSGHTSSTMAVVSALTNFYPDKTWLKIAGYSYVAYMIFAVSSLNRGGMHWFSDAIAAAFMSYAIGSTVGKYYRSQFRNSSNRNEILPRTNLYLISFGINF